MKASLAVGRRLRSLHSFTDPSKPGYYSTPVPRSVIYAGGDPEHIETLLPYFNHTANRAKSLVILKDLADSNRPLFVITSLSSHFFPRGTWTAYLYQDKRSNGLVDRLQGSLTLYLEPAQLPYWLTWRFLARYLSEQFDSSNTRRLRIPQGVLLDPTLSYFQCTHLIVSVARLLPLTCHRQHREQPGDLFISSPLYSWQQGKPEPWAGE
jgi:hypothetical protein